METTVTTKTTTTTTTGTERKTLFAYQESVEKKIVKMEILKLKKNET